MRFLWTKRAKVLFTLFNKANADSLLYYTLGNAKCSLHLHGSFCISWVTQIESAVISPATALADETFCRASKFRPCVLTISSSRSSLNLSYSQLQPLSGNTAIRVQTTLTGPLLLSPRVDVSSMTDSFPWIHPVCFSGRTQCADSAEASSVFQIWIEKLVNSKGINAFTAQKMLSLYCPSVCYRKLYRRTDVLP